MTIKVVLEKTEAESFQELTLVSEAMGMLPLDFLDWSHFARKGQHPYIFVWFPDVFRMC